MKKRNRKDYFRTKIFDHRRKIKIRAVEYKGGKCEKCAYDKCISALEFHHPEPDGKDFSISNGSYGWESVKREIEKCVLLCCRCHREIHDAWVQEALKTNIEEKRVLSERRKKKREELFSNSQNVVSNSSPKKIDWPDKEELSRLIETIPITSIARQFGVSHMSVRHKCEQYEIKTKPAGYWSKIRSLELTPA